MLKNNQNWVQKRTILLCSFNEETNKEGDVRIVTGSNKVIREWAGERDNFGDIYLENPINQP